MLKSIWRRILRWANGGFPFWPSCTVYIRDDAILIFPEHEIGEGGWQSSGGPVTKLDVGVEPGVLGKAILESLKQSHVIKWNGKSPLPHENAPQSIGFKSFGEIDRGALMLQVRRTEEGFHVSAWVAAPGGHEGAPDGERISSGEPPALGATVRELSKLCVPRRARGGLHTRAPGHAAGFDPNDVPYPFGYKSCWVAVPSIDVQGLVESLRLKNVERCSWEEGVRRAYEYHDSVFVTPPVDGWTMAVGRHPEAGVEQAEFVAYLEELSRRFGKAYYFGSHRVVGYHVWAVAERGAMKRAFGYGNDFVDIGERTPEERELGIGVKDHDHWPDEEDVLNMAARWVLDPRDLDLEIEACGPGWYGVR